jgi:acyl carrier protein
VSGDDIESTTRDVFAAVLGRSIDASDDIRRDEEERWDSLRHVELMFTLEEELGVRFTKDDLNSLSTMSAVVERVRTLRGP